MRLSGLSVINKLWESLIMYQKTIIQLFQCVICLIFLSVSDLYSQIDTLWTKTFGGSSWDYGNSVQQTDDEGYIIVGSIAPFSSDSSDVWLIKTDAAGDTLWTNTFGGIDDDRGFSVQQTVDGGYIIAGSTKSFGTGSADIWLIKTNADGDTLWTKTYGGSDYDFCSSVQQTIDGGYILTGSLCYSLSTRDIDLWLIKTDAAGKVVWSKTFGGSVDAYGNSVQQTMDKGFIITGRCYFPGNRGYDLWLIKTDTTGNMVWTKTYGGALGDMGVEVRQTDDEGYIITGTTRSFTGNYDLWLIKTNLEGDTLWTKTFGGNHDDGGNSVKQTMDGGYIVAGYTASFGNGGDDVWLIKTNANGDTLWTQTFGGTNHDESYSIRQNLDGGYIITGATKSFGAGGYDVWLIKTISDVNSVKKENFSVPLDYNLSQNYPNPFNPVTSFDYYIPKTEQVMISIFTISGQLIELKTMNLNPGVYRYEFNGSAYSTGIYIYRISTLSGYHSQRKMLLLK
jgi:hypothetical protein